MINATEDEVGGIVEIESPIKTQGKWTFIGAPFNTEYKLECIKPSDHDISISKYDYTNKDWSNDWATITTEMEAGEGYFAWPFYSGVVTYTTYGDVCEWNEEINKWEEKPYNYDKQPATALNNVDVIIIARGRWFVRGFIRI